jgi:multiple sugar transport system ATP-binding protein
MRDGYIEQVGTPLDLYDVPANKFVASFIGSPSMNLIEGQVAVRNGKLVLDAMGLAWPLPNAPVKPGDRLLYGTRPEHLTIDPNGMETTIVVVEPTGAETHVLLQAGEAQITGVFRERLGAGPGASLRLSPDLARVHLFDTTNGLRIGPER